MGIIKQGILGGFSGKVGNVVGASWKGIDYIRSLPSSVSNPRTVGQVRQRTKFSLVQGFLTGLTPIIRVGFQKFTGKQSAYNAAMSYNVLNGIVGEGSDVELDYPSLLISRGNLFPAPDVEVIHNDGDFLFEWDNMLAGNATLKDTATLLMYNKTKGESQYSMGLFSRATAEASQTIPATWKGDTVECYVGFVSEDGKEVSNSIYAGSVETPEI